MSLLSVSRISKFLEKRLFSYTALTVIALLAIANVAIISEYSGGHSYNESAKLRGVVQVFVKDSNGLIVSQTRNDTIFSGSYDFLVCALWNDVSGFGQAVTFAMMYTVITTITTTITLPQLQNGYAVSPWIMNGVALSSNSVTTAACSGLLVGNGLSAKTATTSHTVQSNSILLTASFTYTGGSQAIQSVCLLPTGTPAAGGAAYCPCNPLITSQAFAWETFSSQTLTNGQSITVQWTFSF